jgi:hypothetical protein
LVRVLTLPHLPDMLLSDVASILTHLGGTIGNSLSKMASGRGCPIQRRLVCSCLASSVLAW